VALDWLETNCDENSPIVIVLPGLTGESQAGLLRRNSKLIFRLNFFYQISEYIKCLVTSGSKIRVRCCVFNNRGLGGIALKTPRLYCAANCEDLSEVVNYVRKHNPYVKIGACGISMGGLILGLHILTINNNYFLINNVPTKKADHPKSKNQNLMEKSIDFCSMIFH
jgi:abhydrolase domain-containing protein 1/3